MRGKQSLGEWGVDDCYYHVVIFCFIAVVVIIIVIVKNLPPMRYPVTETGLESEGAILRLCLSHPP